MHTSLKATLVALFIFCLSFATKNVLAQVGFTQTNNGGLIEIRDLNGQSLIAKKKNYDDIAGSPFLNPEFNAGTVQLMNGKILKNISINFNLESNEMLFIGDKNETMVCDNSTIKKFSFQNLRDANGQEMVYKNGYAPIDKQTTVYFYQVLTVGKHEILKKQFKYISTTKNDMTNVTLKQFEERSQYYIASTNSIQELKLDKQFLPNLLSDKQKQIDYYLYNNKLNLKKIADVVKLVQFYNSL